MLSDANAKLQEFHYKAANSCQFDLNTFSKAFSKSQHDKLNVLELMRTNLSSSVFEKFIFHFPSLTELDLRDNSLTTIPNLTDRLPNLTKLNLKKNFEKLDCFDCDTAQNLDDMIKVLYF